MNHSFGPPLLTANNCAPSYQDLLAKLKWKPISQITFKRQMTMSFRYAVLTHYFPEEVPIPLPTERFTEKIAVHFSCNYWTNYSLRLGSLNDRNRGSAHCSCSSNLEQTAITDPGNRTWTIIRFSVF